MAKPNVVSKQELIEAAKQCIVEQGLEKLTLKMVAERIGGDARNGILSFPDERPAHAGRRQRRMRTLME
ncbi:hypothetical protein VQ056_03810 [Paenibacillus sp. JTLBN-2024]